MLLPIPLEAPITRTRLRSIDISYFYIQYILNSSAEQRGPGTFGHKGSEADGQFRDGAVVDPSSADPDIQGIRRLNELLAAEPRVTAAAIQTVGSKGYDGFTMILVTAD